MINNNSIYSKIANVETAVDALTNIGTDTDALIIAVAAVKIELDALVTTVDTLVTTVGTTGSVHPNTDIIARLDTINDHLHSMALVYPALAAAVTLTASATPWTFGNYAEIVPINTITSYFDIHYSIVGNISNDGDYLVSIAKGGVGAEILIAQFGFTRTTNQVRAGYLPVHTPIQVANTRISARIASSVSSATTAAIKLMYHTY